MPRNVAVLLFDEVEVLDFAGPFEVFGVSRDENDGATPLFNVYTVAEKPGPVLARNGLSINPAYTFDDCPTPELLVVPGGRGTRALLHNENVLNWIAQQNTRTELTLSVCTGALLLGKAGVLAGLAATTYHTAFEELRQVAPDTMQHPGQRFVDNGRVITSAGVSAGIDMSLYVVGKLFGKSQARWTADYMEYEHWKDEYAAALS
ncbi:MAG: DJ-1/PfpI family protein [bacterium]|nr:DJ-1/PfpI family protein [bacterium]